MLVDRLQEFVERIFDRRPYIREREVEIPIAPDEFWKWFEKCTTPHPEVSWPGGLGKAMKGLPPIIGVRSENHFELYRGQPGDWPVTLYINRGYLPLVELHGSIEPCPTGSRIRFSFYRERFAKGVMLVLTLLFGIIWIGTLNSMRHPPVSLFELMFSFVIPTAFSSMWTLWVFQSRWEKDELEALLFEPQRK